MARADAKYTMLKEAQRLGDQAQEWTLSREVVEQLASQYELGASYLTDWYLAAIRQKQPQARITELASIFKKDVESLAEDSESIKLWQSCEQKLVRKIQKTNDDFLQRWCFEELAEAQDLLERRSAEDQPLWQGVATMIEKNDITNGVQLLSTCRKPEIQQAASKYNENKDDFDSLLGLISALANSKEPNFQRAATALFRSKLQEMSLKQIAQSQEACFLEARQALSPNFLIMLSVA